MLGLRYVCDGDSQCPRASKTKDIEPGALRGKSLVDKWNVWAEQGTGFRSKLSKFFPMSLSARIACEQLRKET